MLAIVFACEKFRPYILGSYVIVHINRVAIKYLMEKKDAKTKTDQMGAITTRI